MLGLFGGDYFKINNQVASKLIASVRYIVIVVLLLHPLYSFVTGKYPVNLPRTFDQWTIKSKIESLNKILSPGDVVLSNEVQNRYYLREDCNLLSLSGITDAKSFAYIKNGDFWGFLKKEKPEYMICDWPQLNNAPYFSSSKVFIDRAGEKEFQINGVRFIEQEIPDDPANPVNPKIYRLVYDQELFR
jgi:hypothetical protein